MQKTATNKNQACFLSYQSQYVLSIIMLMLLGCKHHSIPETNPENLRQGHLQSFSDGKYIFFLGVLNHKDITKLPPEHQPTHRDWNKIYTFLICSTSPSYSSNTPKYITDSGSLQPKDRNIIQDSCIPAFRRTDNSAMYLLPSSERRLSQNALRRSLLFQSATRANANNTYHIAAFGAGASLNALLTPKLQNAMIDAAKPLIGLSKPTTINQLYPAYVAFGGIYASDSLFKHLDEQQKFFINKQETDSTSKTQGAREFFTSLGLMAGGAGVSRILMYTGQHFGGTPGLLAGYAALPFFAIFLLSTKTNPPKTVKKHLKKLFSVFSKQQAMDHLTHIDEDIDQFVYAFGNALQVAGWDVTENLASYCMPASNETSQAQCYPL